MKHSDEADVIYGDCELRFGHSSKIRGNLPITCIKYRLPACHQSFVMKRSVIERLGGFRLQYKVYGDFDLIQRAYIAGFNFKELNLLYHLSLLVGLVLTIYQQNLNVAV